MLEMIEKCVRIFHKSSDMALVVWNISLLNTSIPSSIPSSYITDTPQLGRESAAIVLVYFFRNIPFLVRNASS